MAEAVSDDVMMEGKRLQQVAVRSMNLRFESGGPLSCTEVDFAFYT